MTDEQIALARRAVACKGWRWMPGMVAVGAVVDMSDGKIKQGIGEVYRVVNVSGPWSHVGSYRRQLKRYEYAESGWTHLSRLQAGYRGFETSSPVPDITDPATLGCLLALVREAHGAPFLQVSVSISREHGYRFECNPRHRGAWVDSEEEALVAALEAAQ